MSRASSTETSLPRRKSLDRDLYDLGFELSKSIQVGRDDGDRTHIIKSVKSLGQKNFFSRSDPILLAHCAMLTHISATNGLNSSQSKWRGGPQGGLCLQG